MESLESNPMKDDIRTKWDSIMVELNAYGSREGDDVPIDENIKEAVAALNSLGYATTASCGGHPEQDDLGSFPMLQELPENDAEGGRLAHQKIKVLLDEFNTGRSTPFTLYFHPDVTDGFRIESIAEKEGERMMIEDEEGYDRTKIRELGLGARAEMQAFTEFLKKKVFT